MKKRLGPIVCLVLVGHGALVALLALKKRAPCVSHKIEVREILYSPPVKRAPPAPKLMAKKLSKPKKTNPALKKPAPKKPPPPCKTPKNQALAQLMEQSLKALEMKPPKNAPSLKLKSEKMAFSPLTEQSYRNEIALYLKQLIILPEPGEATVKLTLSRDGTVLNVALSTCTNEKNRPSILHELSQIAFPSFGPFFKGEKSHTFLLTLNST